MATTVERLQAIIDVDPSRALAALAQTEAAFDRVARSRRSRIEVQSDPAQAASLEAQLSAASARNHDIHLGITWDREALATLNSELDRASRDRHVNVELDANVEDVVSLNALLGSIAHDRKITVDVDADVAGIVALEALMNGLGEDHRVRVDVDADAEGLVALEALLNEVGRDRHVNVVVDADIGGIVALESLLTGLAASHKVKIDVDTDVDGLVELEALLDSISRDRHINIKIDVDGAALAALQAAGPQITQVINNINNSITNLTNNITQMGAAAGGAGGALNNLGQGASGAGGGFGSMLGGIGGVVGMLGQLALYTPVIVGIVDAIGLLPGVLSAAAAAAGGLVGALAPLAGLAGALPGLIGAGAAGIGTLVLGFQNVSGAVSALDKAQTASGSSTNTAAQRARDYASAQRQLADANRRVITTERDLARAQAQVAEARKSAAQDITEAHRSVTEAMMNEQEAAMRVAEVQNALGKSQSKIASSAMTLTKETDDFTGKVYEVSRVQADQIDMADQAANQQNDLIRAQFNLQRAQEATARAKERDNQLSKDGVDGSQKVIDALRRVESAQDSVASAHAGVAEAQERLERRANPTVGAINKVNEAMKKLTPTGQEFVRFIHDRLMPAFDDIVKATQDGLFPGIQNGLGILLDTYLPDLITNAKTFGTIMGDSFKDLATFLATPEMKKSFEMMNQGFQDILRIGLPGIKPLIQIFVDIANAGMPLAKLLTGAIVEGLNKIADWMNKPENAKKMEQFFTDSFTWLGMWADVLKPLVGIFTSVAEAAKPLATEMLKGIAGWLEDINKQISTPEGKKGLTDFFTNAWPAIRETGGAISDVLKVLFVPDKAGEDSLFTKTMKTVRSDLIPAIDGLITTLSNDKEGLPRFVTDLSSLVRTLDEFFKSDSWKSVQNFASTVMSSIGAGITFLDRAIKTVSAMGQKDLDGTRDSLDTLITGVEEGPDASLSGWDIFNNIKEAVSGFLFDLDTQFFEGWDQIKDGTTGFLSDIGTEFVKGFDETKGAFEQWSEDTGASIDHWRIGVGESFTKWNKETSDTFTGWVSDQGTNFTNWDTETTATINKWTEERKAAFETWRLEVGASITGGFTDWWAGVQEWWAAVVKWAGEAWAQFTGIFTGNIKLDKTNPFEPLVSWFQDVIKRISPLWNTVAEALSHVGINVPKIENTYVQQTPVGQKAVPINYAGKYAAMEKRAVGGPVEAGVPYIVGEHRPEVFVPREAGRILPQVPPSSAPSQSQAAGMSADQFERILERVLSQAKPNVQMDVEIADKTDPMHIANELAWQLR